MNRIIELLYIRNEDNKIEINAEIYNILCSENIKQEETMDTLEHFWTEHKKAVIIVAVVIVVLIIL